MSDILLMFEYQWLFQSKSLRHKLLNILNYSSFDVYKKCSRHILLYTTVFGINFMSMGRYEPMKRFVTLFLYQWMGISAIYCWYQLYVDGKIRSYEKIRYIIFVPINILFQHSWTCTLILWPRIGDYNLFELRMVLCCMIYLE